MPSVDKADETRLNLESSLMNEVIGDNLKELVLEGGEIAFDQFLEEGVFKEIPFFGAIYKSGKAIIGLREAIFAKKVFRFLIELKDIPQERRKKFIEKLNEDDTYRHKVGEKLIVLLDQLDDLEKPEIIGRLLKAAVEEKISYEDFLRLSSAVQKVFLPDLKKIKSGYVSNAVAEQFGSIGIYSLYLKDNDVERRYTSHGEATQIVPVVRFRLNDLGRQLIQHGLE